MRHSFVSYGLTVIGIDQKEMQAGHDEAAHMMLLLHT
jgi:hypothetical protein